MLPLIKVALYISIKFDMLFVTQYLLNFGDKNKSETTNFNFIIYLEYFLCHRLYIL